MQLWIKTSLVLCLFGFLKEFLPSEPFSVHYLSGPWLNFTEEMVNHELYPVMTYSYISHALLVLLLTDLLRYKPVIITEGLAGLVCWGLYTFGSHFWQFQVAEGFDGLFAASEVAYYAYMYTSVAKEHYQRVSSYTRSACLLGHSLSAVLGQSLSTTGLMDAHSLYYITVTALSLATIWSLLLPPVKYSLYFHQHDNNTHQLTDAAQARHTTFGGQCLAAYRLMKQHLLQAYTNPYVIKWSVWWALAYGCYLPAYAYNQLVYKTILKENGQTGTAMWNGAAEALSSLLGAGVAFCCGWLQFNWRRVGMVYLAVGSIVEGAMICLFGTCTSIWLGYATYSVFVIGFQALITITNAEVAKNISEDSYGLVFGLNGLMSLLVKTTVIVTAVSGEVLTLTIRQQYMVFGGCIAAVGIIFSILAAYGFCCQITDTEDEVPKKISHPSLPVMDSAVI